MLVLGRKKQQTFKLIVPPTAHNVEIEVIALSRGRVGIEAHESVRIIRGELEPVDERRPLARFRRG